ncbi:hypothetical protein Poli38472_003926 [Pythium oligandrum]|uniref:CCT domain-containing protein n=1 Tax=Pythium oligandrum TaxID=41045 RepID=A0A8K1CP31_PYTOL|nr:hypothetical protein Poli38472_003926 [Pythium oligandrum]|eukprot:TMW66161.1 hypothetical protein Poli38472_003926 [Pythium oligandrum]
MCLSPQDKLKGSTKVSLRKKAQATTATVSAFGAASSASVLASTAGFGMKTNLAMEVDVASMDLDLDLDLEFVEGEDDQDMDDAGWISDDNLRALEFDDRLNQDIDWVTHDDVETSLKLDFIPSSDDVQDFGFDPSSFLSPLRGGLAFEDSDMSSSFAESSLSVDIPRGTSQDAEKLLMSFDTMNFTIPSPTSSSSKKQRVSLFGKKDVDVKAAAGTAARASVAIKGSMSPSLKHKAGQLSSDESRKDDPRASLSKLSIPSTEPFLGVLSITTPTTVSGVDPKKKIGSYSPEARKLRIQKFHEKRKNRTWKKSIKYDCRKKLADDRPRIKGRFVRVTENAADSKDSEASGASSAKPEQVSAAPVAAPVVAAPVSTPTVVLPVAIAASHPASVAAGPATIANTAA